MRVLILGANGMLGSMMEFVGNQQTIDTVPVRRNQFNALTQPLSVLKGYFTDDCCVINCMGAIPQKKYSDEDMVRLNTTFPLELALLCHEMNIPLIHISTNCVFSGATADCKELDIPDATDLYGKSKANGEPTTCVVLRCSIIGPEVSGASGLLEWFFHSQESVSGYTDHFWNGLTTLELAKTVYGIIGRRDFTPRIQHMYSATTLSKYELLMEANRLFHKDLTITPVSKGTKYYTLTSHTSSPSPSLQSQLAELALQMDAYRAFVAKDIFLITSVINTGSAAWSYTSIRSVFTLQDRFHQTLKTIETIRALQDGTRIVLSECSQLDASMETVLKGAVDIYLNFYEDKEIQAACIQSNKKGYGELLQTRHALQYLQLNKIPFRRLFKISGRYWLTDAFRKSRFPTTEYAFNAILPNSTCHPTVLYSVPYCLIGHYKMILEQCNAVYKQQVIGYETLLPPLCNPKTPIDGVGVAGLVAVDGTFYSTP